MHEHYEKFKHIFHSINSQVKILDIPAIVANLLEISYPYVNLGVFHPALSPSSDLLTVHKHMIDNLI